jgi:hypothetical protein
VSYLSTVLDSGLSRDAEWAGYSLASLLPQSRNALVVALGKGAAVQGRVFEGMAHALERGASAGVRKEMVAVGIAAMKSADDALSASGQKFIEGMDRKASAGLRNLYEFYRTATEDQGQRLERTLRTVSSWHKVWFGLYRMSDAVGKILSYLPGRGKGGAD